MKPRPLASSIVARALWVWILFMVLAILNGGFREAFLVPRVGVDTAHRLSTVLLCSLIALTTWWTIRWLNPRGRVAAVRVGAFWLVLTLAFEFGFGRFVAGKSWSELFADYNLLAGRVWTLVLVTVFLAPLVATIRRN